MNICTPLSIHPCRRRDSLPLPPDSLPTAAEQAGAGPGRRTPPCRRRRQPRACPAAGPGPYCALVPALRGHTPKLLVSSESAAKLEDIFVRSNVTAAS